jgi:NRPS condensation-like uncharacterized protein
MGGTQVRELGAEELILDTMEHRFGGAHLIRVVDFAGPVDAELLETAFRRLVDRRPLFRSRIDRSGTGRPVFVIDDDVIPGFMVVEREDDDHWIREATEELNTPITVADDTAVRARLLVSEGHDGGEIILTATHAACDGRSFFAFSCDLLRDYEALRCGEPPPAPPGGVSPPIETLLPESLTADRRSTMIDEYVAGALEHADVPLLLFPYAPGSIGTTGTSHLRSCRLPAPETEALRQRSRANGTSVTGAIVAAQLQALAALGPGASGSLALSAVTIDVRRYLREPVPLANLGAYAGNIFTRHTGVECADTWALARDVAAGLQETLDRGHQFAMPLLVERFVDRFVEVDRPVGSVTLANLGRQDLDDSASALRPRCIRGGSPLHMTAYPGPYCQAVTTSGELWLTFSYVVPHMPHDLVRDYTESVVDRLRVLAGSTAG